MFDTEITYIYLDLLLLNYSLFQIKEEVITVERNRNKSLADKFFFPLTGVYRRRDYEVYLKNNLFHREHGPAYISGHNWAWYNNGLMHRDNFPAALMVKEDYYIHGYYKAGKPFRNDGPAIEVYKNGKLAAIQYKDDSGSLSLKKYLDLETTIKKEDIIINYMGVPEINI